MGMYLYNIFYLLLRQRSRGFLIDKKVCIFEKCCFNSGFNKCIHFVYFSFKICETEQCQTKSQITFPILCSQDYVRLFGLLYAYVSCVFLNCHTKFAHSILALFSPIPKLFCVLKILLLFFLRPYIARYNYKAFQRLSLLPKK